MKYFILSIMIFAFLLGAISCAKEPAEEPLLVEDFDYDEIKAPLLSEEEFEIYEINLERFFSKTPSKKLFDDEVIYFDSDLYGEDYRSDYLGNAGEIIDSAGKAVKYFEIHSTTYDPEAELQRPYTVKYDDENEIWLVTANPDYLIGRAGSGLNFMIARDGKILAVWVYHGYFHDYENGYFSILDWDTFIYKDFSIPDSIPIEINTAREAAMKAEELWGGPIIEQRPYIVSYDPIAEYWMVEGNGDYLDGACGGVAYAMFSRDGKGKAYVFHTE